MTLFAAQVLPTGGTAGTLAGRVQRSDRAGPVVVAVRDEGVFDVSVTFPTMTDLTETKNSASALSAEPGDPQGLLALILANTDLSARDVSRPWMLAPIDLHLAEAAGVTFLVSMLEQVIEEQANSDPNAAAGIRAEIDALVDRNLQQLKPGSPEAARAKALLIEQKLWSQYLEVGIGPDAEIFTKAPSLEAVMDLQSCNGQVCWHECPRAVTVRCV